jgi:hypothetical protein
MIPRIDNPYQTIQITIKEIVNNPYFIYVLSFSLALLLYQLNWSAIYPVLTLPLICFLSITFIVAIYLGINVKNKDVFTYKTIHYNSNVIRITILNYLLWSVNMAYSGGIPLLSIIRGDFSNIREFGMPILHVSIVGFTIFFCLYLFHQYLSSSRKQLLYLYVANLLVPMLAFNRSLLMNIIIGTLFLYIHSKQNQIFKLRFVKQLVARILPIMLVVLFIFGFIGNVRTANQLTTNYQGDSDDLILMIGNAKPEFYNTGLPKELFWAYIYLSSPLANLQENISFGRDKNIVNQNYTDFLVSEIVPDFISKRINGMQGREENPSLLIHPALNVGTVYLGSYYYLSWIGLILMGTFIMAFPIVYISLLRTDECLFICGVAMLNTMYFFVIFDNIFALSGMSFQLVYPLILSNYFGKINKIRADH